MVVTFIFGLWIREEERALPLNHVYVTVVCVEKIAIFKPRVTETKNKQTKSLMKQFT